MLKTFFISQSIKSLEIDRFIRQQFPAGDYSEIEIQNTPLGTKIVIYTNKPGKIIGKGGFNIDRITETSRVKFSLENPQIDVKEVKNPNLDAKIVAKQIKSAIEKGYNYKKIGNLTLRRVMDSGAMGAEIVISGKIGGSKANTGKFIEGHIIHSGDMLNYLDDEAFEAAYTRPGVVGIRVRIMETAKDITGRIMRKGYQTAAPPVEEIIEKDIKPETEEIAEPKAAEEKAKKEEPKAAEGKPKAKKEKKARAKKKKEAKKKGEANI